MQVAGFIQTVLVLVAAHHGLGKSTTLLNRENLKQAEQVSLVVFGTSYARSLTSPQFYYVSNIFYAITLGLIKCSATCFVANLTVKNMGSLRHAPKQQKYSLYVVIALAIAWTIGSAVTLGVPCEMPHPLISTEPAMCMGTTDRWLGVFLGDAASDLAIIGFAASVIWRTQASVAKRLVWYTPFLVRLWYVLFRSLGDGDFHL